ncbi:pyridoxal phosphate-dependent aminotransferase [Lachnoclostridium sp. An169]|uniref:pyridoxal phosphate-dependent aminotransferase n=1 Tax=Lachnoclostridium sp. An169 TaxID=1965569 RepID=UPI00174CB664|nr:histidinol-phosphate transaminase [Lachnoclostridium sp. An169]HJA67593.1 aminotransferase class I/II-fold pyridoxal phosphate-dependent enzyme [Candidatus Mediterraneibacter cottocaccae]
MEYGHGGDIYTYKDMLDFSVNVNPFGMSGHVAEAAKRGVDLSGNYPDSRCRRLRQKLSEKTGLPMSYFVIGNGAADLFFSLVLAEKPRHALIPVPAFSEYEQALRTVGCRVSTWQMKKENGFCLTEDFTEALEEDVDMVFLCSPSNPAGRTVHPDLLREIAARCEAKKIRLVLDECFVEFLDDPAAYSMADETRNFCQLFVVRAFTKMHAVPGLRLGYGITSDEALLEQICQIRQPWSVSVPAQEAGIAALDEEERAGKTRKYIRMERARMEEAFARAGMEVVPSEANFILVYTEKDLFEELKKRGILIRDCSNYRGLGKGWYRMAVRLREENDCLLGAVREICGEDGQTPGRKEEKTR